MSDKTNSINDILAFMKEFGAHVFQTVGTDKNEKPIYLVLVVEHPDEVEIADVQALQKKWEKEGDQCGPVIT